MPPRRSARVAAAAELAAAVLPPLPLSLVHRIFLLLEVDERARASCVARSWRDVLADPALWTRLDLADLLECYRGNRRHDHYAAALLRGAYAACREPAAAQLRRV